jgi:hypothetical protein
MLSVRIEPGGKRIRYTVETVDGTLGPYLTKYEGGAPEASALRHFDSLPSEAKSFQEAAPDPAIQERLDEKAASAAMAAMIAEAEIVNIVLDVLGNRQAPEPAPKAPLLPAPDALMSDWGEVGAYPGVPDDFVQLMTGDETLEQAVERMTIGVDELLDMATVLSDPSLELALCTVPPERVNEWTEKLITEKARLRRLRGTVDENFGRENLVSRVQGMFAQVGAKR